MKLTLVFASVVALLLASRLVLAGRILVWADDDEDDHENDPDYAPSLEERVSDGAERIDELLSTWTDPEKLQTLRNIKDLANYTKAKCSPEVLNEVKTNISYKLDNFSLTEFIFHHLREQAKFCEACCSNGQAQ